MKRQFVFASSIVLALAAGMTSFATTADAAFVRHNSSGHAMGHFRGGNFRGGHFGGGNRYAFHHGYGHGRHWAGGGWRGGYDGGYYDYCGPVQLALGLCAPYRSYYGPFGIL